MYNSEKRLVDQILEHGKPVVVITQMLDSGRKRYYTNTFMISDVATAVFDAADSLMLSMKLLLGNFY